MHVQKHVLIDLNIKVTSGLFNAQVLAHHAELLSQAGERRAQLQSSRSLQQFLRDAEEASSWAEEKIKVAGDESYKARSYCTPTLMHTHTCTMWRTAFSFRYPCIFHKLRYVNLRQPQS